MGWDGIRRHGVDCIGSLFFFFQAEDGIRDLTVTGVQTCALPIFAHLSYTSFRSHSEAFLAYRDRNGQLRAAYERAYERQRGKLRQLIVAASPDRDRKSVV